MSAPPHRHRVPFGFAWLAALALIATPGHAKLKTVGEGKKRVLDPAQFEGDMKTRYELFAKRCTKCHEMARPIQALETGITPVTGSRFERSEIKAYVVKMMRKPKSGIDKKSARQILKFLWYARNRAKSKD